MDRLSALRTFGNPSLTPVKIRIYSARWYRIYSARWYVCTFQNTESDIGGGLYLANGEYTELLPGNEARRARDARLNHLNAITEHAGQVWAVHNPQQYGRITYHGSEAEASQEIASIAQQARAQLALSLKEIDRQLSRTDADINNIYGQCSDWQGVEAWRDYYRGLADSNREWTSRQASMERIR